MVATARACTYAFINVSPVFTNPQGEAKHGQNVVDACHKAGIIRIVQSSVRSLERLERGELGGTGPKSPTLKYRYSKIAVERSVLEAGFERWTIVQVRRLLNSYVDLLDIGRAVTMVLEDNGDKYQNKKMKRCEAQLTFPEIINIENEVLGDERVRIEQFSEAEVKELQKTNLIGGCWKFS